MPRPSSAETASPATDGAGARTGADGRPDGGDGILRLAETVGAASS